MRLKVLGRMNAADISRAIVAAPELYEMVNLDKLSDVDRGLLGQALVLGGHYDEGWTALAGVAEKVTPSNHAYGQWLWWQPAWAAWWDGDRRRLKQATRVVLTDTAGDRLPRERWEYSQWLAAWLLDDVSEAEFTQYCGADRAKADDAPFFIGEKRLREGKRAEAKTAYKRSVKLAAQAGDSWPANWARWRLGQLEDEE